MRNTCDPAASDGRPARAARALGFFVGLLCACEPSASADDPGLSVTACAERESCVIDFADVAVSTRELKPIRIANSAKEAIRLRVALEEDPFFLELLPTPLGAGLSADLVVSVRPLEEGALSSALTLETDGEEIEIELRANGVGGDTAPALSLSTDACAFGFVGTGDVATCDVRVSNEGGGTLVLEEVALEPADGPFALVGAAPRLSPVDGEQLLRVRFAPDEDGAHEGTLSIVTNAPDGRFSLPLSGDAGRAPRCVAALASPLEDVAPGDDVRFTLAASEPAPGAAIAGYTWTLVDKPSRSNVTLAAPESQETGFATTSVLNPVANGVDVSGRYCVAATVTDDRGRRSANVCTVCVDARFQEELVVELTWDSPENDLDLHVTKESAEGEFCITNTSGDTPSGLLTSACSNGLDCNFASCQGEGGPEWDGVEGTSAGDPRLALDDINGFGPERIVLDAVTPGRFLIGVNQYQGTSEYSTYARVNVFVHGALAAALGREIDVGDYWEVAVVRALGAGSVCVEDLTDLNTEDDCP